MIKRIIEISAEAAHLAVKDQQLLLKRDGAITATIPIEDIGILITDNPAVTYSHTALNALLANNVAMVICGKNHHPTGMFLPMEANTLQAERFAIQAKAKAPIKKRIWQQLIQAKIRHQAWSLEKSGVNGKSLRRLAEKVRSGDISNIEGHASQYYWPLLFGKKFRRRRDGLPPNNLLNYGYAVLRASVARALCGAGLHPSFGVHHHNRYNAYCLADDVMEPFRPLVDNVVWQLFGNGETSITQESKLELLGVLSRNVDAGKTKGPLMVSLHHTAASLLHCLAGEEKCLALPGL